MPYVWNIIESNDVFLLKISHLCLEIITNGLEKGKGKHQHTQTQIDMHTNMHICMYEIIPARGKIGQVFP